MGDILEVAVLGAPYHGAEHWTLGTVHIQDHEPVLCHDWFVDNVPAWGKLGTPHPRSRNAALLAEGGEDVPNTRPAREPLAVPVPGDAEEG